MYRILELGADVHLDFSSFILLDGVEIVSIHLVLHSIDPSCNTVCARGLLTFQEAATYQKEQKKKKTD